MKRVIVTGANGFIGSSLIKRMIEHEVEVYAVDISFKQDRLPNCHLIHRIESGVDTTLTEKLPSLDYDAFCHLAWRGVNGTDKADPIVQLDNIRMAIDAAKICKKTGVKKYLCSGTVAENAVYSLPNLNHTNGGMMYGVAKHTCRLIVEDYCKNIDQDFIWMQFSNIYGEGNRTGNLVSYTLDSLLEGKDATFGPALQPYDFIYVDDLIEAVYRLCFCDTRESFYFIGSGSPKQLKDYLLRIGEITGCEDKIKIGMRPDDGIRYDFEMFDNWNLVASIGEYVSTDFDNGIAKTLAWLKELN